MKKIVLTLLLLCPALVWAQNVKPFVIPELQKWQGGKGEFLMTSSSAITYDNRALKDVAEQFAADVKEMFAVTVVVREGKPKTGDFALALNKKSTGNREAYTINIGRNVSVAANEPMGAYWATRTLLQIMEQSANRAIPCGAVEDYPAYPLRGFMLDVGRKFFTLDYLYDVVKMMSYYKMNTFQVHLNDNGFKEFFEGDWSKTPSGFRLESTTYPGLASKDGHYTKAAFRQFQLDALAYGVTVIPEIDAPAHTLAFSHYDPELGSVEYGADHLDLFNEKSYKFMDGLFKEYLEGENPVFVGDYVHIGTDEYSNRDKAVVEKFRYFTDRYIKYVESFGKKAALWGALTHAQGDTPVKVEDVLMGCWYNGYAEPRTMIELGYDVISVPDGMVYIVPVAGYYYDYLNTKYLYEKWTPAVIGKEVFEEGHPKIRGGMFAVWNDHAGNGITFQDVQHRLFPAIQTLALKMWDGKNVGVPYEEFEAKRLALSEAPDVNILALPKTKGEILNIAKPQPSVTPAIAEIGWDYKVDFDILLTEKPVFGTVLFESPATKLYVADRQDGKLAFERDGYTVRFPYSLPVGRKVHLTIEGTAKETKLVVDGKEVANLDIITPYKKSLERGGMTMKFVRTLIFPLTLSKEFRGEVTNLRVLTQE